MPSPAYPRNFFRYFLLALLGVCLGAVTLAVGLGAGRHTAERLFPRGAQGDMDPNGGHAPGSAYDSVVVSIDYSEVNFSAAIEAVRHAVVSISVYTDMAGSGGGPQTVTGSGSGFIFYVDEGFAYVATNNHVVESTSGVSISLDDETRLPARTVGACRDNDLAVLRVPLYVLEESGNPFAVATLGSSDMLRIGDPVAAIGNALGGGIRATQGIVSARGLTIRIPAPGAAGGALDLYVMQTDASVNRGNSGGPLINQYGEVVGIITAKFMGQGVEGMGYVLPMDNIRDLLEDLRAEGSVVIPFMGIESSEINAAVAEMFNLPVTYGRWVTRVFPNTPAQDAGLLRGDIIVRFGEVEITDFQVFRRALIDAGVGATVTLGILRRGDMVDVEITLGAPR